MARLGNVSYHTNGRLALEMTKCVPDGPVYEIDTQMDTDWVKPRLHVASLKKNSKLRCIAYRLFGCS